jgi:hypothetical protein
LDSADDALFNSPQRILSRTNYLQSSISVEKESRQGKDIWRISLLFFDIIANAFSVVFMAIPLLPVGPS